MRIGILSDVHVHRGEHRDQVSELIEHVNAVNDLDLLVCAGDISHVTTELRAFLDAFDNPCPRSWVPGNHDIWVVDAEHANDSARERYRHGFAELSRQVGWTYLPDTRLDLDDYAVAVVGTMGWFSDDGFSEWFDAPAGERDRELARAFAADLEAEIASVPEDWRLIVVTHHVPDARCLDTLAPGRGECNEYIASVIARHKRRIAAVIHGHRHYRHGPRLLDEVPFYAHPFGYPGQHDTVEDGLRVVELVTR